MVKKLIRFFKSYIEFCAEGAETEKLLNYCIKNGIEIIDPHKENYKLFGKIHAKEYKKLRKPSKKIGLKIRINKKNGLFFFVKKNKSKIGFVSGIIFIIVFNIIMNCFIWEINVTENKNNDIDTEKILKLAEEKGLFTGTLSGKHFVQNIEWYILREVPDLSSVEINIQGSVANISVKKRNKEDAMVPDDDIPINLIASRYGVIEKIDVFDGQGVVKPGDAVMKGDLLVSAVYEDRHNKLTLKHSRAHITAKTDYNITVEFPFEQTYTVTDEKSSKIFKLIILGKEINFYKNIKNELPNTTEEKDIFFLGIKLPIKLIITHFYNVKACNITYNLAEAKSIAYDLLSQKEKEEMKEMEILSKKAEEKIKEGKYIITANYIVIMDFAEEQAIVSDTRWENTDDMS